MVHLPGGEYTKSLEKTFEEITEFELVRRFAKPLKGKPFREFESLPLRFSPQTILDVLIDLDNVG